MNVATGAGLDEIEAVYRARYRELLGIAAAFSGSLDAGRDAVHDAFVSAVRGRSSYRREGTVEAWLWRSVVRSALKRRPREAPVTTIDIDPAPAEADTLAEAADLRAAIAQLPERQRHVLFLRHYADLDYAAIADSLGISRGTVAATLHAARASLKALYEEVPAR
jgi:RNA polymerase sigma-70 factor (ECF subfamily)